MSSLELASLDSETAHTADHLNGDGNIFQNNSNYTLWMKSPWRNNPSTRRLIAPIFDIPSGLDVEDAPQFVIGVNTADPMYAEGLQLTQSLRDEPQNANVSFVQAKGSHYVSLQTMTRVPSRRSVGQRIDNIYNTCKISFSFSQQTSILVQLIP